MAGKKTAKKNKKRKKHLGYLNQLNRARRFLKRIKDANQSAEEFQDMAWVFFQNCWHVKDWLMKDARVGDRARRKRLGALAEKESRPLKICQGLCNGTKHLNFDPENDGAPTHHVAYTMNLMPPGAAKDKANEIDFVIHSVEARFSSGKKLAEECITEWERILRSEGLATS